MATSNTYYAPDGIPGFYGAPSTQQSNSIPYLPEYIASSEQQQQQQQQQFQPQPAPYTAHPYSPDSYPIQMPIMIQPDTSSPSFWEESRSGSGSDSGPGTALESERGLHSMVQKLAGMFGVDGGEDARMTELLLKLGKKAYKRAKEARTAHATNSAIISSSSSGTADHVDQVGEAYAKYRIGD